MEHLVYVHELRVYSIDSRDIKEILEPCKDGKKDDIILSWKDGEREKVLYGFLTGTDKKPIDVRQELLKEDTSIDSLLTGTHIYFAMAREFIDSLYTSGSLSKEEFLRLRKENLNKEKSQIHDIKKQNIRLTLKRIFFLEK